MATRSKKVLKTLADKAFEPEKKTKKATPKKKAEPKKDKTVKCALCPTYAHPGAKEKSGAGVMTWGSILESMKELGMDIDNIPAMAQLPAPLHIGTWADGSERIATHIGCCIDEDNLHWDFFQAKDGKVYHINMRKIKPKDLPPPPQTDKNIIRKNEVIN